jgi:hypothetical protein
MADVRKVYGARRGGKAITVKLITICQLIQEYPAMMIVITDNPRFQAGRWTTKDIDEALVKIKKWMKEHLSAKPKNKK